MQRDRKEKMKEGLVWSLSTLEGWRLTSEHRRTTGKDRSERQVENLQYEEFK